MTLHAPFVASSRRFGERPAVKTAEGASVSYGELAALTDRIRDALRARGVTAGDRVGIHLPKSVDSVAVILGVLKTGAVYVPVDPASPPARAAYILHDCAVRLMVTEQPKAAHLVQELARVGASPEAVSLGSVGDGRGVRDWLQTIASVPSGETAHPTMDSPAYILYTSGSTGNPKGVVISHRAALSFVDWCSDTFTPSPDDRFSSHAPFHFDLSIHDIYLPLKHGASVLLIGEQLAKDPLGLAQLIETERLTVWYSTPSTLAALEEHGRLERHDCTSLRHVLFAGEVFPIQRLRRLMERWPRARYFNLYGPTETNVCTWYEVPGPLPPERTEPLPIGRVCAHYRARVVEGIEAVARGERGELLINGPGVMTGYWNLPDQNQRAFQIGEEGERWYHTGDVVSEQPDGTLLFFGRRDRMVKRHGYRIELGEIEAGLGRHPAVASAAVVARPDEASGVVIHAFLKLRGPQRPSIVDLKRFCMQELPQYMSPDRFAFVDAIPQTSTHKTDYQALLAMAGGTR